MTEGTESTEPPDTSFRFPEFILIVLTCLLLLVAVVVLKRDDLIAWGLLSIASIPLLIMLTPLRKWKHLNAVYAILFSCLFIGLLAYRIRHHAELQPAKVHSAPVNSLSFVDPSESVPWCTTLTGEGTIPDGDSLLIFDSPAVDLSGELLTPIRYGFQGVAIKTSNNNWIIKDIKLLQKGDSGSFDKLFGVLVSNQTAGFVQSITVSINNPKPDQSAYWRSGTLPSGLEQIKPLLVQRKSGLGSCGN
jgi:hypothetical protein